MFCDKIFFESEKEFSKWVKKHFELCKGRYIQEYGPEEVIVHEKAHFDMAISLGYNPVYAVAGVFIGSEEERKRDYGGIVDAFQVDYKEGEKRPKLNDLIKILLAPKDPSESDIESAKWCRSQIRDERLKLKNRGQMFKKHIFYA